MKKKFLRCISFLLALTAAMPFFCGCKSANAGEATRLRFGDTTSISDLRALNGQTVTINGYIATSSPADGSFIFLMNLPYQSCPFCVPNTSQLANTIEVYPKKGEKLSYSNQAIKVTGTLVVAEDGADPFTDPYEYEFYYKIVDADYTIINLSELSGRLAVWQKVAEADLVSELYDMFNYVYFTVAWPEFYVNSWTDTDGTLQPGYYLYAGDAITYITKDGAQYNYGYVTGYFENLQKKFAAIDSTELTDIIEIIDKCSTLADRAVSELMNGSYTSEYKYVSQFGQYDTIFTLNDGDALLSEYDALYYDFCKWIDSWEIG